VNGCGPFLGLVVVGLLLFEGGRGVFVWSSAKQCGTDVAMCHGDVSSVRVPCSSLGVVVFRLSSRYMAEFEDLRVPQELSALRACSKPALARGLWRDYRHKPRAVRLIAQIMVDFTVNDANLWLAVLRQLRLFGHHRHLLALLEPLSSLDCVRGSEEMATLWQQVRRRRVCVWCTDEAWRGCCCCCCCCCC